jgi:putative ABC transport system ATP-binding protein
MMLEIKGLSKAYRTDTVETKALNDFSLSVAEGEFVTVTGPSGAGKSTFLNIVGMLETFDSGQLLFDGVDVSGLDDNQRSAIRNEKIGFIFQGFNLLPELNVIENVSLPLRFRNMPAADRKQRAEEALATVGLSKRASHYPSQLSGGQQQRVAIARAIAGKPRFLLADEPTGNLDSEMAVQVFELIEQLHKDGSTIIVVTHDKKLAQRGSRCINVLDGRCIEGSDADIRSAS